MTLAVVLIFTIGSVSAQSVEGSDGLSNKSLKSNSAKTAIMVTESKVATNAKVTNGKNTKTTTKTSAAKKTASKESGTKAKSSKANTTTINKKTLAKTSTSFMNYVEKNGKFPKVKISNKNYSNAEYLYLVSKAVENNSNSKIEIRNKLVKPYNNTKSKSVKGSINKTEYVKMAGKTRKFIEKNQRAPNWVSSSKGKIPCNQLILMYSKCLDTYNKTGKLPNAVKLDGLDLDAIKSKLDNKSKSTTTSSSKVKADNKTNSSKTATANKTTTKNTSTTKTTEAKKSDKTETNTAENPIGQSNKTLAEKSLDYVQSLLNNILDRLDPSKFKIDLTKSDEGNVKFNTSKFNVDVSGKTSVNVQISAKNTTKTTTTKKTTTKKTTRNKTTAASSKKTTTKKTTSNKTTAASSKKTTTKKTSAKTTAKKSTAKVVPKISQALKAYLSSSKNCQVTNKEIKSLATKLTSTLKSDYDKGKKLFEWVRDHIGYDKYRNTRRGAVKTLQNRLGNCVDQSHLLVALSRAAGIPARYVNGNNCRFTTGYVSGHVWTEMYIKNKWTVADTTSSRNTLGTIRNWNTKSFSLVGKYSGINF